MKDMSLRGSLLVISICVLIFSLYNNFLQSKEIEKLNTRLGEKSVMGDKKMFELKQECEKYRDSILKQLEANGFEYAPNHFKTIQSLTEIFYSPKTNSCLYVLNEGGFRDGIVVYEQPKLVDALSNEVLQTGFREPHSATYLQDMSRFNDYVDGFR